MHPYKAVFIDIDGTIVYNRQLVSSAYEVVHKLQQAGIKVALCTGRAYVHAQAVQRALGLEDAVYFNGGLAISQEHVVLSLPIQRETTEHAIAVITEQRLHAILHTDKDTVAFETIPSRYQPILHEYQYPPVEVVTKSKFLDQNIDVFQMNVFMPTACDDGMRTNLPECLLYRWHEEAIDLQRGNCDKSLGAKALLDFWSLSPEEAIHLGDGANDIGMFHAIGHGVAMGNASDEVKQQTNHVTDTAENHGVLKALQKLGVI